MVAHDLRGDEDLPLLERLNIGDEDAFRFVFEQYQSALVRLASNYVPNMSIAEEVVQETWLAVFRGVRRFERRSSLRTWIFSIMLNRARSRAAQEGRYLPLADEVDQQHEHVEPLAASNEWRSDTVNEYTRPWIPAAHYPERGPETRVLSQEMRNYIESAIEALPVHQREVITLRDVEQFSSEATCDALGISEINQRVLLHRARSRVRRALENYLSE